jgi:deoxyribose-phosphate aldolase
LRNSFKDDKEKEEMVMNNKTIIPQTWQVLSGLINYSNLAVDARENDIRLLCLEAQKYLIGVVVVSPVDTSLAAQYCQGSKVKVASAISYPIGADLPEMKRQEIQEAIADGAKSIYMQMAVGAFRERLVKKQTRPEIENLVEIADGRPTTLITEGSVLTSGQINSIVKMSAKAGVNNIAVCSGFERSRLPEITNKVIGEFVDAAKDSIGIVYMGRVKDLDRALELIKIGVSRICTPDARKLLQGYSSFPFN